MGTKEHYKSKASETEIEAAELARRLFKLVNAMHVGKVEFEAFEAVVCKEHRTLKQNLMRFLMEAFFKPMADDHNGGWTDARNEESAKLAASAWDEYRKFGLSSI